MHGKEQIWGKKSRAEVGDTKLTYKVSYQVRAGL